VGAALAQTRTPPALAAVPTPVVVDRASATEQADRQKDRQASALGGPGTKKGKDERKGKGRGRG
jgi:hypothetical protein